MRSWSILSAFALAGFVAASPALAHDRSLGTSAVDESTMPYASALIRSDAQDVGDDCQCVLDRSEMSTPAPTAGASIEGQIAALEPESGRFVLDTDDGLIALTTDPEELRDVSIGDVVRVSFLPDEGE